MTSEENKSSPDRIKIENLKIQLQKQEEQIKRFEEQIKNARKPSEQNTDVPSSGVSTDLPSPLTGGGIDNDRTTSLGNSYTDSKTVALMIERAMEKNQVVLSKLAESVTSQGEQIRRAVDRMA